MSTKSCKWTDRNVWAMLTFLESKKAEGGDGGNFKAATWNALARHLGAEGHNEEGGEKSGSSCKNKWTALRAAFSVVQELKKQSGFAWDDAHGACIEESSEHVWEDYVKVRLTRHPTAAPYKNKGFPYYNMMEQFVAPKAKGRNI
ncbi:hypothetical protein SISSUDRAFT_995320, partial [Sistotremastrum suecicum HHB10207 ss-3]